MRYPPGCCPPRWPRPRSLGTGRRGKRHDVDTPAGRSRFHRSHRGALGAPRPDRRAAQAGVPAAGDARGLPRGRARTGGRERLPGRGRRDRGAQWLLTQHRHLPPARTRSSRRAAITAVSPDLIKTGTNEEPQLNLFMYYVSLNPALRNLDLPSYDAAGRRVGNPPLALEPALPGTRIRQRADSNSRRRSCWAGR